MADQINLEELVLQAVKEHCVINGFKVTDFNGNLRPMDIVGFDSLIVEEVSAQISKQLGMDIPLGIMANPDYSHCSISEIARKITKVRKKK
jgi:hypothetical protein